MTPPLIAVAAPLSGSHAGFGAQVSTGVRAALAVVNALQAPHNAFGAKFFDDACRVDRAIEIARQIVLERPVAVIGHVCSDTSVAASEIYAEAGIPMITPASSSEALTAQGRAHVFRVAAREGEQASVIADFIGKQHPDALVGLVREDDYSAQGHTTRVAAALAMRGIRVGRVLVADDTRLATISSQLLQSSPKVVFYGGHDATLLGKLVYTLRMAGYGGQILSNDGAQQAEIWQASRGHAEGLTFAFEQDHRDTDEARDAVQQIAAMGARADGFTLNAFACVEILHQAFAASDAHADHRSMGERIAEALHRHTFATSRGTIRFDSRGEMLDTRGALFVWRAGRTAAWTA